MTQYKKEAINELALKLTECGFKAYIAKSGEYGFYTDNEGTRVCCFQYSLGEGITFSGNYKGSARCGSGWQIGSVSDVSKHNCEQFKAALYATAPQWANPAPVYTTPEQHLANYGDSSGYSLFNNNQVEAA